MQPVAQTARMEESIVADPWEANVRATLVTISGQTDEIRTYLSNHPINEKPDPNLIPTDAIRAALADLIAEIDHPSGAHEGNLRMFIKRISDGTHSYHIHNQVPPPDPDPNGKSSHKEKVLKWFQIIDRVVGKLWEYLQLPNSRKKSKPAKALKTTASVDDDIETFVDDIADMVDDIDDYILNGYHMVANKGGLPPASYAKRKKGE
jgi:hypothetical protein